METINFKVSENETVAFAVEEETTLNGVHYLLVSEEVDGEFDAYILKEITAEEDGEEAVYEMVEDDTEFAAIARIFDELMDEETDLEYK